MPRNTERFTVYLTDGERVALRLLARHLGTSENGTFKLLLRDKAGLSVPEHYQHLLDSVTELLPNSHDIYR